MYLFAIIEEVSRMINKFSAPAPPSTAEYSSTSNSIVRRLLSNHHVVLFGYRE